MNSLSVKEREAIENELEPSERVLWAGKPNPKVILHSQDTTLIPFSLMWGGFFAFWEYGVIKQRWGFGELWGVPFLFVAVYLIFGRFIYENWKKRRIVYVLTNQRAIVIVRPPQRKTISARLAGVCFVEKKLRSDGIGTITIGTPIITRRGSRSINNFDLLGLSYGVPVFADIDDANQVYRQIEQVRASSEASPVDSALAKAQLPSFGRIDH